MCLDLRGRNKGDKAISWDQADKEIGAKLNEIAAAGGKIAILSGTLASPSTKSAIEKFKSKYPNTSHIAYNANSLYQQ